MASTNLPSIRTFKSFGRKVLEPKVAAALEIESWSRLTLTKNSTITSTFNLSEVMRACSCALVTTNLSVFRLITVLSCTMGSTILPPSKITFAPPKPVRMNASSFVVFLYNLRNIIPNTKINTTKPMAYAHIPKLFKTSNTFMIYFPCFYIIS